jgi:hypothetical protein
MDGRRRWLDIKNLVGEPDLCVFMEPLFVQFSLLFKLHKFKLK